MCLEVTKKKAHHTAKSWLALQLVWKSTDFKVFSQMLILGQTTSSVLIGCCHEQKLENGPENIQKPNSTTHPSYIIHTIWFIKSFFGPGQGHRKDHSHRPAARTRMAKVLMFLGTAVMLNVDELMSICLTLQFLSWIETCLTCREKINGGFPSPSILSKLSSKAMVFIMGLSWNREILPTMYKGKTHWPTRKKVRNVQS